MKGSIHDKERAFAPLRGISIHAAYEAHWNPLE